MSALSLLCEIIAQRGTVTSAFYRGESFKALAYDGFLREVGVAASVVCQDCDAPHPAPVVFEDGGYGYFCADCGFVPLDHAQIKLFAPDLPGLVHRLADVFACKKRKSSALSGLTWRIGAAQTVSEPVTLYFHPTMQTEKDARDLQNALAREARSDWRLVVTAQGRLPVDGLTVVGLDDLVDIDADTGTLRGIGDPGTLASVPRRNSGGRPSEYRYSLKPLIESRMQTGEAAESIYAETRAVRAAFQAKHPDSAMPSEATVKRYIREARGGS